jgi:outer membrane protein TolC
MNKVALMPKVGLMGAGIFITPGISFGTSKIENLAIVGLSASWKIDALYKNNNNKNLDKIKADKIANQQETFLFTNNLQLSQTSNEIEKQKAIIEHDNEIVRLKTDITKSYQTRFDNGMCTMNDLINAMNRESEARANQALHNVQLLMSYYNYQYISGN